MSHDTHQGEIRPQSVSRSAIEKRLKRHLAKSGFSLVKSRIGSRQHDVFGEYAIFDDTHELIAEHVDIVARARSYGLMDPNEQLSDSVKRTGENSPVDLPTEITGKDGKKRKAITTTTTNGMPTSVWEKLEGALLCLESAAMALEDVVRGRTKAEPIYLTSIAYTVETALAHMAHARHELGESQ